MSAAIILVLTIASGDNDPSLAAISSSAKQLLGDDARIVFEPRPALPPDDEAAAAGEAQHARALVEIAWLDRTHEHVRLRVHLASGARWVEREIAFSAKDDRAERGRTLGLAIGSMVPPEAAATAPPPPPPEEPAPPPPPPAPEPAAPPPADRNPVDAGPRIVLPPPSPRHVTTAARFDASVHALGAAGLDRTLTGVGAGVALGWRVANAVWIRGYGQLTLGDASSLGAQASIVSFGGAVAWYPLEVRAFAAGVSARAFASREQYTRATEGVATEERARWTPGVGARLVVEWRARPDLVLFGGAGPDVNMNRGTVYVGGDEVGALSLVRLEADLGARIRF